MTVTAALLIELAWKSSLVAGAALGLLWLARGRSPAERSWIAHIGLVALLLLPPVALLLPDWNPLPEGIEAPALIDAVAPPGKVVVIDVPELAAAAPETGAGQAATGHAPEPALPRAGVVAVWLYLLLAALLLAAFLVALVRLSAMHRRASVLVEAPWLAALAQAQRRMGFKHGTALLVSDELRSPVSWGLMRPIILLNPSTVEASREAEAIIAHELAHVARLDWAKLLVARLACALLWFNPLVWLLAREAHQLREEAADDAVLLSEVPDTDYASLLVNAARHDNHALLLAAHGVAPGKNSLHRRILRVLDASMVRRPAGAAWTSLCLIALFVVAAPLAALDPLARPAAAEESLEFESTPEGLGHIVAGVVADTVPRAIRDAVHDSRDLAKDEEKAREEKQAGDSEADRLIEMKAVGLSAGYIAAMNDAGFRDADVDDMVSARAVGVTPEYAREMRRLDPTVDLDDVVEARAVGFSPDFLGRMRQIFPGLAVGSAVEMSAVGVDPTFAREMRALFPGLSADQAVEMRAIGVTPEFVREMRRQGLSARSPDEAVEGRLFLDTSDRSSPPPSPPSPPAAAGPDIRNLPARGPGAG